MLSCKLVAKNVWSKDDKKAQHLFLVTFCTIKFIKIGLIALKLFQAHGQTDEATLVHALHGCMQRNKCICVCLLHLLIACWILCLELKCKTLRVRNCVATNILGWLLVQRKIYHDLRSLFMLKMFMFSLVYVNKPQIQSQLYIVTESLYCEVCVVNWQAGRTRLRRLVASLSQRRPVFVQRSVHMGFVVDKVALGQVFLRLLWLSHQYNPTVALYTHISSGGWTIGPLAAAVQRQSHPIDMNVNMNKTWAANLAWNFC
jgi:hypothetical protein